MTRNIERLPKRIYLFAALLLIAACLLISLLPRTGSDPIESAKSVLQGIPLYPGATQIYREDTDTSGSQINHRWTFCSIECARITYEAPDRPGSIIDFYEHSLTLTHWRRPRSDYQPTGTPFGGSYEYGPSVFRDWTIVMTDFGLPAPQARYDLDRYYLLDLQLEEKSRGITGVELIVRRLAPMASDTPIPTLPPPPPTAVIPIAPGSVMTAQPLVPAPLPTAP